MRDALHSHTPLPLLPHSLLSQIDASNSSRAAKILEAARERAAGASESDLRRLKRQVSAANESGGGRRRFFVFSTSPHTHPSLSLPLSTQQPQFASLKNTFTLYDVKDGFIDGLTEGGPDGGERERLAQFESQAAEFGGAAKAAKAANAASADALRGLIDRVCGAAAEFEAERDAALAALADVEAAAAGKRASSGEGGGEEGAGAGGAPALPPTADEAEAAARLAAEAEAARALEADIAAAEAEAASLAAAAAADDAAADALQGEADRLGRGSGGAGADHSSTPASLPAAGRLATAAAWCDEAAALVSALAGVEVEAVEADGLALTLRPSADMCDGGGDREGDGPPRAAAYALRLAYAPGSDTLVGANLSPPDVDLSGAVAAAVAAAATAAAGGPAATLPRAPASALVHEALALTSARLRRMELVDEASAAHALASVSAPPGDLGAEVDVVAVLRCGVEVRVRIPPLWPRTGAGGCGAGGLALVSLTPPRSDTDLSAARAKLEAADLGGGSLCGMLSAAAAACEGVVG